MNTLLTLSKRLRKATFALVALTIILSSCGGHSPKPKSKSKQHLANSDGSETKKDKQEKSLPEAKQTPKEKIIPPAILPGPDPDPEPEPWPYIGFAPDPMGPVLPDGPCPTNIETPYDAFQVDVQPEYPGGMSALMTFIDEHLIYPPDAIENSIEGRVFVRFTVLKTGETKDFKILRGLSPTIDREVIRMLKGMEKWQPGMLKNEPVDVYFTLPVKLSLD
jgi:TonB family protein